jgi:hypothetical protein
MQLHPIAQGLLNHPKAACRRRQRLARLNKANRLLLELKRVPAYLPFLIFVSPSLLKQLAKGYVLRGQGQSRITGTQVNELGSDFYIRLATFEAVTVLTWLASQFPTIGSGISRLLQSGPQVAK